MGLGVWVGVGLGNEDPVRLQDTSLLTSHSIGARGVARGGARGGIEVKRPTHLT